jgi:superoxide reductase
MNAIKQIYKCNECGNVVEILVAGGPIPVCCGQDMTLLVENTVDASREKHVPVIEDAPGGILVKVGSLEHPMLPEHYIAWIEVMTDTLTLRADLKPGMKPEAFFPIMKKDAKLAREYCTVHGLWINS